MMREDWEEILYQDAVYKISTSKQKLKQKEYSPFGEFPVVDQGQDKIGGYSDDKARILDCNLPVVVFGDHTKCVKLINFKFIPGADGTKVLEPKQGIEPKYISTLTHVLVHKIKDKGYARHYQHIEKENLPLAPLPEQRAIVAKIEELFSSLDQGIHDLKKAQEQLKVYRQAVLKKAFEGELTKEWRKQQTDLHTADELLEQIKVERQKHYEQQLENWKQALKNWEEKGKEGKKPGKPKEFKLLPELSKEELDEIANLPNGWKWLKNENYLFEVKDGTHDTPKYQDTGIPFVTQKNIKNNSISFSDIKYISEADHNKFFKRSNVQKGDIIIAMIGHGRGNSCIVDTEKVFSIKNVGLFKFFNEIHINRYCLHYYQSTLGLNLALKKSKGGAQPFIGLTELRNWPIPVCSPKEQHQIVQEIESRLSVCDKVEQSITESLEKAKALRQSILKKAFEGTLLSAEEIAACKAAADYEPASVLLERIKKEKKK